MSDEPNSLALVVSADVDHAFNPNYADLYLAQHTPRLNVGVTVSYDSNAHMTTGKASRLPVNPLPLGNPN